jgi:hypothetical protein
MSAISRPLPSASEELLELVNPVAALFADLDTPPLLFALECLEGDSECIDSAFPARSFSTGYALSGSSILYCSSYSFLRPKGSFDPKICEPEAPAMPTFEPEGRTLSADACSFE